MRLAFAVLADAATTSPDGKFSILGGDVVSLMAPSFPTLHPMIALVAKIEFEPSEYGVPVALHVEVVGPNESDATITATAPSSVVPLPRPEPAQDIPQSMGLVSQFIATTFPSPGKYRFRILANGAEVGSVSLYLLKLDFMRQSSDMEAPMEQNTVGTE